nr:reverse transcriptase domain-containing protein [Tanacetum cinerariifolium]
MQQDRRGSVTSRFRRPPTDQLTSAEGRNSKIQEVSQHSESRSPSVRGEHRRGRRSGCSRSMSGSPKRTSVFSRIRRDRSESPRHRPVGFEDPDYPDKVYKVVKVLYGLHQVPGACTPIDTEKPLLKDPDGSPGVRKIQAVLSTAHGMLKFLVSRGILTLWSSRIVPLKCTMVFRPEAQQSFITQAAEERIKVAIHSKYSEQTIAISPTLTKEGWKALCELLRRNLDIFSWKPEDMTGNKAIQEEVEKLVDARIMKEVYYHSWLSNPIMVKKHEDSWRMCMDFKDLNKACPKDGYLLPRIDWKVESLCGYPLKCFLDTYKGYHQIKIAKEDEEKMAFITSQGIICYSKMPFGLKNVGATYQRLVDKAFQKQICRNLEVYVEDLKHDDSWRMCVDFKDLNKACPKDGYLLSRIDWKVESLCGDGDTNRTYGKEELIVYLAAAQEVVSAILMTERDEKQMQFISLAVPYKYMLITSVKGQILADFIVERPEDDSLVTTTKAEEELPDPWTLFTDGSSCIYGSEAGLILTNPEGT